MATTCPTRSPEQEPGGRRIVMRVPNPRRTPSSSGVSMPQNGRKRRKLSQNPEKDLHLQNTRAIGDEIPIVSAVPSQVRVLNSQASGSSDPSDKSASKWFNDATQNINSAQRQQSDCDDEPPFYMTNHAHYIPANFAASSSDRVFGAGGGAAGLGRGGSHLNSENEDLRGVIDDLTVENKRLRHMIRVQSRRHRSNPSHVSHQQDKLFDVRMHGLPPAKRQELEYLLKDFATTVQTSERSKTNTSKTSISATSSGQYLPTTLKGNSKTDSGYASMLTPSPGPGSMLAAMTPTPKLSNSNAVKSYLQEIPDTLLPKHNPVMSQRAKQALVVRRLEQLFTGRIAAPGPHDQPIQQQEISQSAERADRLQDVRNNRNRKVEGSREARVMSPSMRLTLDAMDFADSREGPTLRPDLTISDAVAASRPTSPDQRPTRPLDLDIHRAQVAFDNIQYIRHLGQATPLASATGKESRENPWVYLNLLTGLAQLHTLNVTPDFVRKALKRLSKRFELHKDGHRVRWTGGSEGTTLPAEDERAIEAAEIGLQESAEDSGNGGNSSKRSKSHSISNLAATSSTPSDAKISGLRTSSDSRNQYLTISSTSNLQTSSPPTKPMSINTSTVFDYKPMFFRGNTPIEADYAFRDSDQSFDSQSGDSSGLVDALSKSNLHQKSGDEGLITFYNNAFFCSDFSTQNEPSNMKQARPAIFGEVVGIPIPSGPCESPLRHHDATYFTVQFAPKPFDVDSLPAEERDSFAKSLPRFLSYEPISEFGKTEAVPMILEACGLGGVTPEDNFALDVKIVRKPARPHGQEAVVKMLPFSRRKYTLKYTSSISSCQKIKLPPSKLPPASYIFFTSSSSSDAIDMDGDGDGDDDDDDDDYDDGDSDGRSSPLIDEEYPAPPAFLQQFSRSSGDNLGDDEEDERDSSDIDLLAIARRANPAQVAEQERVYMLTEPGGMQRMVAGSLAATVGASMSASSDHEVAVAASWASNISDDSEEESQMEEDEHDDT